MAGVKGRSGAPKGNKNAIGNKGGGRKPVYRPEMCEIAQRMCEAGAGDQELANRFGVDRTVISHWRVEHIEFAHASKVGKEPADDRVERSMFERITGYWLEVEKVSFAGGKMRRYKVREWQAPSDVLTIFWMKNRRPELWRETRFNVNMDLGALGEDELANRIADAERQIAELQRVGGAAAAEAGGTAEIEAGAGSPTRH